MEREKELEQKKADRKQAYMKKHGLNADPLQFEDLDIEIGKRVQLFNFHGANEKFNGTEGTVIDFNEDADRWVIKFDVDGG